VDFDFVCLMSKGGICVCMCILLIYEGAGGIEDLANRRSFFGKNYY